MHARSLTFSTNSGLTHRSYSTTKGARADVIFALRSSQQLHNITTSGQDSSFFITYIICSIDVLSMIRMWVITFAVYSDFPNVTHVFTAVSQTRLGRTETTGSYRYSQTCVITYDCVTMGDFQADLAGNVNCLHHETDALPYCATVAVFNR